MTETELVRAAQGGDESAFEELVRTYEKRIYHLSLRMCGNQEDALEIAQEAFLGAWRGLRFFRGDSSFSTWLYRLPPTRPSTSSAASGGRGADGSPWMTRTLSWRWPTLPLPPPAGGALELRQALARGLNDPVPGAPAGAAAAGAAGPQLRGDRRGLELDLGTVKSRIARAGRNCENICSPVGTFPDTCRLT